MDFNATTHGQRDIDDDRLSNLIERISEKRLGLKDVEADIIGRSYEYLIRKFAEGSGQSAGEFFTPPEVARIMARIMDPEPGLSIYDPCCGSAGLLIACEHVLDDKMKLRSKKKYAPLKMHGQEYVATTWAMANMNTIIHDMEGTIEIGDTFKNPKFRAGNRLQTFDRVVSNPMWNQDWFKEEDYDADELGRFPQGAGFPGAQSADWGWAQHILASLNRDGRAAIVLDTGAASRGSGNANKNKEKAVRQWFVEQDVIEGVIYLPENLFYNTSAPGILLVPEPEQAQGPQGQAVPRQRQPGGGEGRPEELHPGRRHRADRDGVPGVAGRGEVRQDRHTRAGGEGGLQHLAVPLHPRRRRRDAPADRGDSGGAAGTGCGGGGSERGVAGGACQGGDLNVNVAS